MDALKGEAVLSDVLAPFAEKDPVGLVELGCLPIAFPVDTGLAVETDKKLGEVAEEALAADTAPVHELIQSH